MSPPAATAPIGEQGAFAPFRYPQYVAIWSATFASNIGTIIQTMAAAWLMASLSTSSTMVALVQTASSLPAFALGLLAGAFVDRFGKRPQMLAAQIVAALVASMLAALTLSGHVTPWLLLLFTLLLGVTQALYLPGWQSSIREYVPAEVVPAAFGLNAVNYNSARCAAPIIGGLILASIGPSAAFLFNAAAYLGIIVVLLFWRGGRASGLPAETIVALIRDGLTNALGNVAMRHVVIRCATFSFAAAGLSAFLPLVARDLIGGGVRSYTEVLTAFGVGAVGVGFLITTLRRHMSVLGLSAAGSIAMGLATIAVGLNLAPLLSFVALFVAGMAWVVGFAVYTTEAALLAPDRLIGRYIAVYQMSVMLGLAGGSAFWGVVSHRLGVADCLIAAGTSLLLATALMRGRLRF